MTAITSDDRKTPVSFDLSRLVAYLEGAEPALPPSLWRRIDAVTHGKSTPNVTTVVYYGESIDRQCISSNT